ncbi:hypothetical protein MMC07_007947 [Pseudocyphellaria aurata]|nr:hypothetical protein [Pseudocyphellaria aurata]
MHTPPLLSRAGLDALSEINTLHDLQIVLGGLLSRLATWEKISCPEYLREYLKTLEELIEETKPMNTKAIYSAKNPPDFTHIFERYVHYGFPIARVLLLHALKATARGNSSAAIKHYISSYSAHKLRCGNWSKVVKHILVTTRTPPSRSEKSLRQNKAWAELVAFRKRETLTNTDRDGITRRFTLPLYLSKFGVYGWSNYFRVLSRICESRYIFDAGLDCLVLGIYQKNLPCATLNFIFNSYI